MTPNKLFQSGNARCYIRQDPFQGFRSEMYLQINEDNYITFNEGGIEVHKLEEGIRIESDQAALIWAPMFDEDIVDIFKAICKALDLYNEDPSRAYLQGLAEGKAVVYQEWVASLTK